MDRGQRKIVVFKNFSEREADALGIDLMGYDAENHSSEERRDIRKAVVLLETGKEIPKDLRERLLKRKQLV